MTRVLLVMFMLITTGTVHAEKIAGVSLEDNLTAGDTEYVLNGAGVRKKLFFKLYVGSLYIDNTLKGADADAIVQADAPMLIQLNILSDLLTRDKLVKALNEGFDKSTGGNTAPVQSQIDTMMGSMNEAIKPGDVYQIVYTPEAGTSVVSGDQTIATMDGLPFKQAIFGIWLSDSPAQDSLKKAMLGQ
ncbi:MAG: chalcone isomerase family protein [Granulosicoccus sp.]